jgi:hypothetical protein
LDQLIENHFDLGDHAADGGNNTADKKGVSVGSNGKPIKTEAIIFGEDGEPAIGPVIISDHPASSIRLRPNSGLRITISANPSTSWSEVEQIEAILDNEITGLECKLVKKEDKAVIDLNYTEAPDFNHAEYPLETAVSIVAKFKDQPQLRFIQKVISIRPKTKKPSPPPKVLLDVPTSLRISSHQPVRLIAGGPDTHVRAVWDGKDEIASEPNPQWEFTAICKSHSSFPSPTLTRPSNGRFEILINTPQEWLIGTKLEFELKAKGPAGFVLAAVFTGEIVTPPGPRKVETQLVMTGQRRPPYKLVFVNEEKFATNTRWGEETWSHEHAASFTEPTEKEPLILCINEDFGSLKSYISGLVSKKADEQRAEEKKTRYISHVAFHLYQMYLAKDALKKKKDQGVNSEARDPNDDEMQGEINRVAGTLIKLMEFAR